MDYAVIRTGGKQYRVSPGDTLRIEAVEAEPGSTIEFEEVLLAAADGTVRVGTPVVPGVRVTARVVEQGKARKILVFKKKRRKNYRRRRGHRQRLTTIRILEIAASAGESTWRTRKDKEAAETAGTPPASAAE